jgi:hypothetical protein
MCILRIVIVQFFCYSKCFKSVLLSFVKNICKFNGWKDFFDNCFGSRKEAEKT